MRKRIAALVVAPALVLSGCAGWGGGAGGGQDLQFPHHENEIAQSEGAYGTKFVNYWMHNGFIRVDEHEDGPSVMMRKSDRERTRRREREGA